MGRGWSFDYVPNGQSGAMNIRDAGDAGATYDAAAGTYGLTVPQVGSGTLYQTRAPWSGGEGFGTVYNATVAADLAAAEASTKKDALLVLRPGGATPFRDVAWVAWFDDQSAGSNLRTSSIGVFGLARRSPASALPASGSGQYVTRMIAYMGGNVGDYLIGNGAINFDFAADTLSGTIDITLVCFMGCSNPPATYQLANAAITRGSLGFSGNMITSGAPSHGTFSGTFAGPNAAEVLISFEAPYFDPDRKRWVMTRGVFLGRLG